ncbi:2af5f825-3455-4b08-87fe-b4c42ee6e62f [Sclerotinia trifoliorum]|uniref:2af5f825-3455-4b08-87fe-b4c42ee6e62f n=1 Tax=Sclerotinia trifoliorum TaxID=28548 RepID=A0A8H2VU10_9HELO|nr:2af5f825-3455-4b08-87fe-b4c42ee6e62f [Sclerotinia trifoliorum]
MVQVTRAGGQTGWLGWCGQIYFRPSSRDREKNRVSCIIVAQPRVERQLRWEYVEPKLPYTVILESLQDEEEFIAPSWTWASRNTGVFFPMSEEDSLFQVIEYALQLLDTSAMIAVKFGSSTSLRGKCRQTPDEPISGCFKQKYVHPFEIGESRLCKKWKISGSYGRVSFWLDWVPNTKDPNHEGREIQRQLQLFAITKNPSKGRTEKTSGLLLLPF